MARSNQKLSNKKLESKLEAGMYRDGDGLFLRVSKTGSKSWSFRYMLHGREREMGLGAFPDVKAPEARLKTSECRRLLASKIDPIEARNAKITQAKLQSARTITFKECASQYIESERAAWRNAKHAWQWANTLERFAYPVFGYLPVNQVTTDLVLKALEPIWRTKTETAQRTRCRIEAVIDWAKARQFREGENPARWKGHLDKILPKPSKLRKVRHQPALPYEQINDFLLAVKKQVGIAAVALEWTILTASRSNETIQAKWKEIDWENRVWTIPENRTKGQRIHRVPLVDRAIDILRDMHKLRDRPSDEDFIFPSANPRKPLSNVAMLALVKRMNSKDDKPRWIDPKQSRPIVVHGFRSTIRDWAAEQTTFKREICEAALSHILGEDTEVAYFRSDLFNNRRQLMQAWEKYCAAPRASKTNNIVALNPRAAKG